MPTKAEERYEELERAMARLKAELVALSTEVHGDRTATVTSTATERIAAVTTKAAAMNVKARAERNLDDLAKSMQTQGESFAKAYSRMMETDLGRSMLETLETATDLAAGRPTAKQVEAHRKSLAG